MSAIPAVIESESGATAGPGWPSWGAIKDDITPLPHKTRLSQPRKARKGIKARRKGNRGRKGHLRSKARHSNKRRVFLIWGLPVWKRLCPPGWIDDRTRPTPIWGLALSVLNDESRYRKDKK